MNKLYKIVILSILSVCFVNCNQNTNNQQSTNNDISVIADSLVVVNNDFNNIVSKINEITLPFSFYCGIDSYLPITDYHSDFLERIAPKKESGVGIIGRLPSLKGNVFIIYGIIGDIVYPYLYVYNEKGEVLDSLYLHISYCLGDESVIITNQTIINKDFSVNMIDTTKYIHYEDNNFFIEDSLKIREKLFIFANNKFVVSNEFFH
jgi:hypothetical protein